MNIEFDLLEQLANEVQGEVDAHYSGRAMFGQTCVGIVIDSERDLVSLGVAIAELVEDDDLKRVLANSTRLDTMGRGLIAYWETLTSEDAPDEDEDEDEDEDY